MMGKVIAKSFFFWRICGEGRKGRFNCCNTGNMRMGIVVLLHLIAGLYFLYAGNACST